MGVLGSWARDALMAGTVAVALLGGAAPAAAGQGPSAYEVKGAFLLNFSKFITWPPAAFTSASAPVLIAIIGDDPFGELLDELVLKQRLGDRAIQVKRIGSRDELSGYHLVFISRSETRQLDQILIRTENTYAVAVSDIERFSSAGGVIGFIVEGNRVRFDINVGVAERRGLKVSTKLIALAATVYTK